MKPNFAPMTTGIEPEPSKQVAMWEREASRAREFPPFIFSGEAICGRLNRRVAQTRGNRNIFAHGSDQRPETSDMRDPVRRHHPIFFTHANRTRLAHRGANRQGVAIPFGGSPPEWIETNATDCPLSKDAWLASLFDKEDDELWGEKR